MAGEKLVKLEKKQRRAAVLGKIFLIFGLFLLQKRGRRPKE